MYKKIDNKYTIQEKINVQKKAIQIHQKRDN